jgi:hypothetical protein
MRLLDPRRTRTATMTIVTPATSEGRLPTSKAGSPCPLSNGSPTAPRTNGRQLQTPISNETYARWRKSERGASALSSPSAMHTIAAAKHAATGRFQAEFDDSLARSKQIGEIPSAAPTSTVQPPRPAPRCPRLQRLQVE